MLAEIQATLTADDTQATQKLNEGVVDVLLNTRCYILPALADTTAGVGDYTMDASILHIDYVTLSDSTQPLEQVRPQDLLSMRLSQSSSSSPSRYYAVQGSDMFMLYPTPSDVETITVYYVPLPIAMSLPEHDPSTSTYGGIPVEFHRPVLLYALSHLADQDDDQTSGQGVRYQQDYERSLIRAKKHIALKGGTTLPPLQFRRRRRRFAFRDNSQDGGW